MASLLFSLGGLGLTSATRNCRAAHWASWTDSLAVIQRRHPEVARTIVVNLPLDTVPNSIDQELRVHLDLPSWEDFAEGTQPGMGEEGQEPTLPRHGWQKRAHKCLEDQFVSEEVWPSLSDTPCPDHNKVLSPQRLLLPCQPVLSASLTPQCSGCCSGAVFAFPSLCPLVPAGVAGFLTPLATTKQDVQRQGCWGNVASHWKEQLNKFAAKGELG